MKNKIQLNRSGGGEDSGEGELFTDLVSRTTRASCCPAIVPQGHLKIAQRFNVGICALEVLLSPAGTAESPMSSIEGRQVKASYCAVLQVIANISSEKNFFQVAVVAVREDREPVFHSKAIKANQSILRKNYFYEPPPKTCPPV